MGVNNAKVMRFFEGGNTDQKLGQVQQSVVLDAKFYASNQLLNKATTKNEATSTM